MKKTDGTDDGRVLRGVLAAHQKWLRGEGGERADLTSADLRGADLTSADLMRADLTSADLTSADLRDADLRGAVLTRADLRGADLRGADLTSADLMRADLTSADLRDADLRGAVLTRADLTSADLRDAYLRGADLTGVNLDFSCFPLWCGGTRFRADDRIVSQVLAHLCSLDVSPKARAELDKVLEFAKTSHRAKECGLLEDKEERK